MTDVLVCQWIRRPLRGVQTGKLVANYRVTFAGRSFEPLTIENGNLASASGDQTSFFQGQRCQGHTRSARANHAGDHFMRQLQRIRIGIIVHHQQPPGESLLERVMLTASHRLSDEREERPRVSQQQQLQRAAYSELISQNGRFHLER